MIPIPDPNKIATGVRQLLDLLDAVLARRPRPAQIVAGIATVVLAPTSLVVGYFLTKEIESSKIYYTAGLLVALQICIWLILVRTPRTGIASRNLGDKYLKDADAARLGGRGREAWSLYEKASGVYEQYGNTSGKLSCLRGIAELERLFGNTKSAEVIFIEAHGRSGEESLVTCELNRGLGDLYRVRDELLRAQHYYDLAEIHRNSSNKMEHAELLTSKAHLQVKQGNATVAMTLYNNAEELFSECNDIRGVMRVKMGRARLNTLFNRPAAAMVHAHDMRMWYIGTKNRIGEANVDLIVAENLMRSGTLPESEELVNKCLANFVNYGDVFGEGQARLLRGRVHRLHEQYRKAMRDFTCAEYLFRRFGSKSGQGDVMLAIAELRVKDREFGEAERIVNNALKIFDEISNRYGVARCYLGMGRLRLEAGKYNESLEMFVQANAYFGALECAAGAARVARGKGRAFHAIGRPDEAWLEYNAALQEYRKVTDKLGEAETLLGTGEVLMVMARFPEARNNIQRSKELFDQITRKKGAARALFCMAKLERSEGSDPRRAFEEAARAFWDADDQHGWARSQFEIARYERTMGGAADNIRSRLHEALVTFERLAARREEVQVRIELAEMGATRENLALIEYFLQSYEGPEAERVELQARMAALRPPH